MKTLLLLLLIGLAFPTFAETYDVSAGTIEVSEDFTFQKGGTDSFMGSLTRKSDGWTIHFDVGGLAGIHMHDGKQADCTFYRHHRVGGQPAATGVEAIPNGRRIITSIGDIAVLRQSPANFWTDIRTDSDIADFLLIVSTYRIKPSDR